MTRSSGFTLIELLVVVAIIGILSAIGTYSYTGYVTGARINTAENYVQQISLAEAEYYTSNGEYYHQGDTSCTPAVAHSNNICLLYTSPSPRDGIGSRMPSSA